MEEEEKRVLGASAPDPEAQGLSLGADPEALANEIVQEAIKQGAIDIEVNYRKDKKDKEQYRVIVSLFLGDHYENFEEIYMNKQKLEILLKSIEDACKKICGEYNTRAWTDIKDEWGSFQFFLQENEDDC